MKRILLLVCTYGFICTANSQQFSAVDFLSSSFSAKKLENYLNKHKFQLTGSRYQYDTIVRVYSWKPPRKKKDSLLLQQFRSVETYHSKNGFGYSYSTSCRNEFEESISELKQDGFFCGAGLSTDDMIFQKKEVAVQVKISREPGEDTIYSFLFSESKLPEKIANAEDLLQFDSHEELVCIFGEKNVIKDVHYISEKESVNCSVLFPKSNRQALFIWQDEVNYIKPSYVLIGGNLNTASTASYTGFVEENLWSSKDGIYAGMNLRTLIQLNGGDFKFYGSNASLPFMVVPQNTGTLNFKDTRIVLGCLNPGGSALLSREIISAGEILEDNPGIYVHMLVLAPPAGVVAKNK